MRRPIELDSAARYIDAMGIIIAVLVLVLFLYIVMQSTQIINRERQLREYHLATTSSLNAALTQLGFVKEHIFKGSNQTATMGHDHTLSTEPSYQKDFELSDHLFLIDRELTRVLALHKEYRNSVFNETTERLSRQFELFESAFKQKSEAPEFNKGQEKNRVTTNLERVLEQLRRLHSREVSVLSNELELVHKNNLRNITIISLLLLMVAVLVFFRVRRNIKRSVKAQKEIHALLARRNAEFEAIFNSISDAAIYTDKTRHIVMTNPAFETIFGYSQGEAAGKTTELLYADRTDYEEQGRARYNDNVNFRQPIYEMRYKRKDGATFVGETLGAKVLDLKGNTLGFIALVRDITFRKEIEDDLHRHKERLEELVEERTRELSEYTKELESFSYSIAHDLRTPLRAIDGFSQLVDEEYQDKMDATGRDHLRRVREAAQHMGYLIDDVLQLSRVSLSDLKWSDVDLSAMALSIAEYLTSTSPAREVIWHIAPELQVRGDATLLRLMLENLLGNAWKYTGKEPHACIEFGVKQDNGRQVYYVKDNGAGFDIKYADKLFKVFHRLHGADEYPGTGVGLATVQRIIQRHGGDIWAEAESGQGATFYFVIPKRKGT